MQRNGEDCVVGIAWIEPTAKVVLRLWPTNSTTEKSRPSLPREGKFQRRELCDIPWNCGLKAAFL